VKMNEKWLRGNEYIFMQMSEPERKCLL